MKAWRPVIPVLAGALLWGCAGPTADMKKEADARMEMGISYLEQRNIPAAMRELTRASELDPGNPEIDMALGLAYRARGDSGKAEEYFRRAIRKKPDYPEAHNNLGVLLSGLGRGDEAIKEYEAAAANVVYATPEIAYCNMGEEYRRRGNLQSAEAMYRRALAFNERYGPAYRGLAEVLAAKGRGEEAIATLEKCVRATPAYAPAWFDLGGAYMRTGRPKDALQAFRNVLPNTEDEALRRLAAERIRTLETGNR
ncbi:MAG: tetratricopeptide repeat protein [Deltaproteobacteria bacterium]|nr:tetratricopeptide repeat protein [Deltaproteobacteria bacterium]